MAQFIVEGGRPLNGTVTVSGNKNEALPAVMACLLTEEEIILKRMPKIGDILTLCNILEDIGVSVSWLDEETLSLQAKTIKTHRPNPALCAKARASILFLGPLLARLGKIELAPPGGDVIGARRMDSHFQGIRDLGAQLEFGPPISGTQKRPVGADIFLDEPSVTASENILLNAVLADGLTTLHNAASEPHVQGLCNLLNAMGAKISGIGTNRLLIQGVAKLHGAKHRIGPDFMEIGSFLCLGAIAKGKIEIKDIDVEQLRFILKTFNRLGIEPTISENSLVIDGSKELNIQTDISGRVATIYSAPWPGFNTDLMSVAIVAATQARGTLIFFEKMYEGRMFFTDSLMSMGANIVLCDPHRIVVTGPQNLLAAHMSSPDVRAGMALLSASLIAKGKSKIDNIYQIERGYSHIYEKLVNLGAAITRLD